MNKIALLSFVFALYACNNFGQDKETKTGNNKAMDKGLTIVKTEDEWKTYYAKTYFGD